MKNVLVYTQHIQQEIANIRSFLPQGRVSFDDEMTRDAVAYGIIRIARQIDGLVRALAQNEAEIHPAYLQTLAGQLETRLIDADFDKVWHNVDVEISAIETEIQRLTAIFEATPERIYRREPAALPSATLAALRNKRDAILAIAARFHVTDVRVFGSVARGDDTCESDIDFLVRLPEDATLMTLTGLVGAWQELLGREIDVVSDRGMEPLIRENILRDATPL